MTQKIPVPTIPDDIITFMRQYERYIIVGHKDPDPDCIGSSLALGEFLRRNGKKVILLSQGPFNRPELKIYEKLFQSKVPKNLNTKTTGLCLLDCSTLERVGAIGMDLQHFPIAIIDHHLTSTTNNTCSIIMPEAPATTYLIQSLIETISGSITKTESEFLLFGLCADTGFFRHLKENSEQVFLHASRLIATGANPKNVFFQLNGGRSLNSRILLGRILTRMQSYCNGALIISYETLKDSAELNHANRDSDMVYQLIQTIEGVEAIAFFRQDTPTECSIGLRSKNWLDVSKIALKFGGGGHRHASGAYITGQIDDLIPKFVATFEKAFQQHSDTARVSYEH